MNLDQYVLTFGRAMRQRYGHPVRKLSVSVDFTCPNRDGSKGIGGCTYCNVSSFTPSFSDPGVAAQLADGRARMLRRSPKSKFLAYFQAYTNTYGDLGYLRGLYDEALAQPDVIGLAVGTRPDCVPDPVLDLFAKYQAQGYEIWLELGLQSAFDATLERVNRGHGFAEYQDAVHRARSRGLQVCTHLIIGLPGERAEDSLTSLERVLEEGTDGLKLHPLHIVKGTQMVRQWKRGEVIPLTLEEYVDTAVKIVQRTPDHIVFHRFTATAEERLLMAPDWCLNKWPALNAIGERLAAAEREANETQAMGAA